MSSVSLEALAQKHNSDKAEGRHSYTAIYKKWFGDRRQDIRSMLEIGAWAGESLRMWLDWFENTWVYGMDLPVPYRPDAKLSKPLKIDHPHCRLVYGDQAERSDWDRIAAEIGHPLDLVIDDGGHMMHQQQITMAKAFRMVRPGGALVIEDLYTSWYDSLLGTDWNPTKTEWTTLRILQAMRDGRDWHSDFMLQSEMEYLKTAIASVTIEKGKQSEIALLEKRR